MELPGTVAGVVIALFALLPGVPAEWFYRRLVGLDWREDKWARTLRLLGFSTFGLALYVALAPYVGTPQPLYILPSALQHIASEDLHPFSTAFLGHVVGSILIASLTAISATVISRLTPRIAYVTAWDRFVNVTVVDHWVVVSLQSGEVYAGYIQIADASVAAGERDVLLLEPALFSTTEGTYRALEYTALFVVGSSIASVAVVSDPDRDQRMIKPGALLFQKREDT